MRPKTAPTILLVLAILAPASANQSSTASITVGGRVGAATLIAPSDNDPVRIHGDVSAQLIAIDRSRITVRLAGGPASNGSRVKVRLLMRTNTAFELRATALPALGAPPIAASVGSIHPTGSGVVPSAAPRIRSVSSAVELSSEPAVLARGPRISRGSASSPRNAIQIELLLEVVAGSPGEWSRDVLVTIGPEGV